MSFEVEIPAHPVYQGKRFKVMAGSFRYDDGTSVIREWIDPSDVVAVLPFDGTYFYLGRQPRELTGGYQLGLCAGKIDPGEDTLVAAKRELAEEFGFEAGLWTNWGTFYSSEGITSEQCTLYLAGKLETNGIATDLDERVEVVKVPLQYLTEAIDQVSNAKAKIALLKLWQLQSRRAAGRISYHLDEMSDDAYWLAGAHEKAGVQPQFDWESLR